MRAEQSNPYPGPRPFGPADAAFFFGREREAERLVSLAIAERVVLFHGPSGAGKTSLLNAQVVPQLEAEGFSVPPLARVGRSLPALGAEVNPFSASVLADLGFEPEADASLSLERALPPLGDGLPRVLVLDQFEEVLSAHAEQWRRREDFFLELARALWADRALSLLLVVRADQLAGLERYAPLLPGKLGCRLGLEPLSVEAAELAVARPAEAAGRPFEPGVAAALVERLSLERGSCGLTPGPWVEPIQLQVVCHQLWTKLAAQPGAAPPAGTITAADLESFGPLGGALERFYEEALVRVVASGAATERELRDWFEEELVTAGPRKLRQSVLEEAAGLPPAALAQLVDAHLLRREQRRGGVWLELVHDTFLEPIAVANQRWRDRQHQLLKDARAWEEAGRPEESFLYEGEELAAALSWCREHPEVPGELERAFLGRSEGRREERRRRARERRNKWLLAAAALAALAISCVLLLRAEQRASATALAFEARAKLDEGNARGVELAIEAVRRPPWFFRPLASPPPPEAEGVFLRAVYSPRLERLSLPPETAATSVAAVALSGNGRRMASLDVEGHVTLFERHETSFLRKRSLPDTRGGGLALSSGGELLASAGLETGVKIFDFDSGEVLRSLDTPGETIVQLALDPDHTFLGALDAEGGIWAWELASGRRVPLTEPPRQRVTTLALGKGGRLVFGDEQGNVGVSDLGTGKPTESFKVHLRPVFAVALDPEASRVVSADDEGQVILLEVSDGSKQRLPAQTGEQALLALAFSAAGARLSTLSNHGLIAIRSLERGDSAPLVLELPKDRASRPPDVATWSGDGLTVAGSWFTGKGGEAFGLWKIDTRDNSAMWLPGLKDEPKNWAGRLSFLGKGRSLALVDGSSEVVLIDRRFSRDQRSIRLAEEASRVAVSRDGRFLIASHTGSSSAQLVDLEAEAGEPPAPRVLEHSHPVTALAAGPHPGTVATAAGGVVQVWRAKNGEELFRRDLCDEVSSFAFSAKGRWLAATTEKFLTVESLDENPECNSKPPLCEQRPPSLGRCRLTADYVFDLVFLEQTNRLVTAGTRGVFVWDVARGRKLLPLPALLQSASGLTYRGGRLAVARRQGEHDSLEFFDLDLERLRWVEMRKKPRSPSTSRELEP